MHSTDEAPSHKRLLSHTTAAAAEVVNLEVFDPAIDSSCSICMRLVFSRYTR